MHGNKYHIQYIEKVVNEDILDLPKKNREIIKRAIEERLMIDPIGFGRPLRYSLKGHRRLRVGQYRIVYCIEAKISTVVIIAIQHRKNIYKDF